MSHVGLGRDSDGQDVPTVHVRCVRGEDHHMPMRTTADMAGSIRGIPTERTAATRLQEVGGAPRGMTLKILPRLASVKPSDIAAGCCKASGVGSGRRTFRRGWRSAL